MSDSSSVESTPAKIKPSKIVLWSILGVILLLLIIVLGSLLVQKYIKKDPVPSFLGYSSMIVVTGSMSGTIEKGDMIIIKKADEYHLGDIVTYVETDGKTVVTHRLVNYGEQEGTFIAKGDANESTDIYPVAEDQIAGIVVKVIPKIGLFYDWVLTDGGIIYILALIVIVVAGVYFWHRLNHESEEDKAEEGAANSEVNAEEKGITEANAETTEEAPVEVNTKTESEVDRTDENSKDE